MPYKNPEDRRRASRESMQRKREREKVERPPNPRGRPAKPETVRSVPYQREVLFSELENGEIDRSGTAPTPDPAIEGWDRRILKQVSQWNKLWQQRMWPQAPRRGLTARRPFEVEGFGVRYVSRLSRLVETRDLTALDDLPGFVGEDIEIDPPVRVPGWYTSSSGGASLPLTTGLLQGKLGPHLDELDELVAKDDPRFALYLDALWDRSIYAEAIGAGAQPKTRPRLALAVIPDRCEVHDELKATQGSKGQRYPHPVCYRCLETMPDPSIRAQCLALEGNPEKP